MTQESGGILMYRKKDSQLEVLLVHMGGPFFSSKDEGAWTIPKGLPEDGESLKEAAIREFEEEVGIEVKGDLQELGTIRQKGGKVVHAWAVKGTLPENFELKSNLFEIEWPPRSGKKQQFVEIDKAEFFSLGEAKQKIIPAQVEFLDQLLQISELK